MLPHRQLLAAPALVAEASANCNLVIACHYPVAAPAEHERSLARKPIVNAAPLIDWLKTIGPHVYCCGHVHAAWAFRPPEIPDQLCLNAGAPLMHDRSGHNFPGFLEITIEGGDVSADHHFWNGVSWHVHRLHHEPGFFPAPGPRSSKDAAV